MSECPHEEFWADVEVTRLMDAGSVTVTGFLAEIKIHCVQCKTQFQFLGPEVGLHPLHPTVSPAREELRAPIAPHDQWSPSLFPAFTIRRGDS